MRGLIHLYWGDSKGKTTAAMGLALRALAAGRRVVIVQFLKGRPSGEVPLLTGLGVFDDIAKRAGAGTLVPITGFANAMVSPALEFKHEGFVTGTGAKLFTVAGPVLAYGTAASVIYGIILWIIKQVSE